MAFNIPTDQLVHGTERLSNILASSTCSVNTWSKYLLWVMIVIAIIKYREYFKIKALQIYTGNNYIRVLMRMPNLKLKPLLVKLDAFGNFSHNSLKDKLYHLPSLQDYIVGYDLIGLPVFFYDNEFILPWQIHTTSVTDKIKTELGLQKEEHIRAIEMRLNAGVFKQVYSKKLLSDIYSSSNKLNWKLLAIIGAAILAFFLFKDKLMPAKVATEFIYLLLIPKLRRNDKP